MTVVSLLKYHGLGNDFLISVHPAALPGGDELDPAFVTSICDRHRGIGADGVIVARPPTSVPAPGEHDGGAEAAVRMELRNADGSSAETSGNGLACLGLALMDSGMIRSPVVVVETLAGLRTVTVGPRSGSCSQVGVEMGQLLVRPLSGPTEMGDGWVAFEVDAGNPHLVLIGPTLEGVDVAGLGRRLEAERPSGQNVEFVARDAEGGLDLAVFERGAGLTEACGSGSCAAAAAARAAGMVEDSVEVHNPGGTTMVELAGDDKLAPTAVLRSPACRVARVELDLDGNLALR